MILRRYVELQAEADGASSAVTDAGYEKYVRESVLPAALLRRCGLNVVRGVDLERSATALPPIQWDFRAPVLIAQTEPEPNSVIGEFEVFPSKPAYVRPAAREARNVTPTVFGSSTPPAAYYFAIFEITTAEKWTLPRGDDATGMLERLEQRLRLTVGRARDNGYLDAAATVTDLVAVVGIVAPKAYTQSVGDRMGKLSAPVFLKAMMEAGRFVFIAAQRPATVSESGEAGGAGRGGAASTA